MEGEAEEDEEGKAGPSCEVLDVEAGPDSEEARIACLSVIRSEALAASEALADSEAIAVSDALRLSLFLAGPVLVWTGS